MRKMLAAPACRGWIVATTSALVVGCAAVGPLPPPHGEVTQSEVYVIGLGDRLLISVWKNEELSLSVPVRPDGMISLPLLDDVTAAGLTPEELKTVVTDSLQEYISNPDVTVVVLEMNSKAVSVLGGVARAGGRVPVQTEVRVLDAIAQMGGFTQWAKRDQVKVLRRTSEGLVEYRFNYEAFLDGDSPESNFLLRPGDTVVVPD